MLEETISSAHYQFTKIIQFKCIQKKKNQIEAFDERANFFMELNKFNNDW